jgi:hypothetical protein
MTGPEYRAAIIASGYTITAYAEHIGLTRRCLQLRFALDKVTNEMAMALERVSRENQLTHIIKETMWMARRYANGRMTYAPGMYNDAARIAIDLGVISVLDFGHDAKMFADKYVVQILEDQQPIKVGKVKG